jgi:hypothetical protein
VDLGVGICRYLDRFSADRTLLANFRSHVAELSKLGMEARDNVKFLTTLERHFKAISHGPLEGASTERNPRIMSEIMSEMDSCREPLDVDPSAIYTAQTLLVHRYP